MSYLSCFGHIQVFASPRYSTYPRRALGILEKRHQRVIQVFLSPASDGALEQLSPQTPNRDLSASPSPGPAQRHQDPRLPEVQPGVRSRNGLGRSAVPWTHGGGDGSCTKTISVGIIHGDNKEQGYQLIHRGGEEKVLLGRTFETWFQQQRSTTTKNSKQLFCQQTFWKKKMT